MVKKIISICAAGMIVASCSPKRQQLSRQIRQPLTVN